MILKELTLQNITNVSHCGHPATQATTMGIFSISIKATTMGYITDVLQEMLLMFCMLCKMPT